MSIYPLTSPLLTDLYELTMTAGYFDRGITADATFSLFIRDYPRFRNYFAVAGIEEALQYLEHLKFSAQDIDYLKGLNLFKPDFLDYLESFAFQGEVCAIDEGSLIFANEPILEVTAPVIQAQIIETLLINTIGLQTMIATKAARCVHAARPRPLIDFSLRRTQGQDAGLKVARCAYLAGFIATSNVLAGKRYGIPVSGTMAHSFIQAFDSEKNAFKSFADSFPDHSIFLIDTYDTLKGAENAAEVALEMRKKNKNLIGVRLDSGDMIRLSQQVRAILDAKGLPEVKIFASSGFDEFSMAEVVTAGAPIDAFGVGTRMGVSADAPYLDLVYKMVMIDQRDVRKLSSGKVTLSSAKQVFRKQDSTGRYLEDVIGLRDESILGSTPLLKKVMQDGKCLFPETPLEDIRNRFKANFKNLDETYKSIDKKVVYPVKISPALSQRQTSS